MRKTYDGTQYRYRKVRDLPPVPAGVGHTLRALLRIEYFTKSEPDVMRVCYAVKHSSWSFREILHWYYVSDEDGNYTKDGGRSSSTVGEAAESAEKLRKERQNGTL